MVEDTMFSGESKNIEYKVSLPDKSEKYMKTIVAFANTQGGKLIVGVDDKTHQIVGVENDVLFQLMDGIANAVSDSCVPQIIPDIEPQTVSGKTVIVVSVEASSPDWETLLPFCCPVWSSEMSGRQAEKSQDVFWDLPELW